MTGVETIYAGARVVGFIAIDSVVSGRATGGVRMMPDVTAAELALLASAMTLKYGFLGLPHGGAKAGIRADPGLPAAERDRALLQFGTAAAHLLRSRRYAPGPDMGTNNDDIRRVLAAAGAPLSARDLRVKDSARFTSLGVWLATEAAAAHAGIRLDGATALIEGLGAVGGGVAKLMQSAGVRVVGTSTAAGAIYDGRPLPRLDLLEQPADILAPCARHHSITAANAERVRARLIVPGANCPMTPEAEAILQRRGIIVFPDFVANCGGVLGGTMQYAGVPLAEIERFFRRRFASRMRELLGEGPPDALRRRAEEFARARFERVKADAERAGLRQRLFSAGLSAFRAGLIPTAAIRPAAMRYFEARLAG